MIKRLLTTLNTIKSKITIVIILVIFLGIDIKLLISNQSLKQQTLKQAKEYLMLNSQNLAMNIKNALDINLQGSKNLSKILSCQGNLDKSIKMNRNQVNNIIKNYLINNPSIIGLGSFWEPNAFDKLDSMYAGRDVYDRSGAYVLYWRNDGKSNIYAIPNSSCYISDYYLSTKKSLKDFVIEPALRSYSDKEQLIASFVSPIVFKGQFMGVTQLETNIESIFDIIKNSNIYDGKAEIILLSNNGTILYTLKKSDQVGKPLSTLYEDSEDQIIEINSGIPKFSDELDLFEARYPVLIDNTETPWQIRIILPQNYITTPIRNELIGQLLYSLVFMLIFIWIIIVLINYLFQPINRITQASEEIANGNIDITTDFEITGEEIKKLQNSFSKILEGLKKTANFAYEIGKGNLELDFTPLSEKDILGNSLLKMRNSLKEANIADQQRKVQLLKENWATEGLAKFNDILRHRTDKIEDIAYDIISSLINYLHANQGGLFLYNDDNKDCITLDLLAAVAYNDKRYINKKIELGDGLVGTCALEKKTIYMVKIPQNYIEITSGLGTANPSKLLLVPLLLNEQVFGIVEIASFENIEEYEIGFVEKLAESIASTLSSSKINQRTSELLSLSRLQADEMLAQEEELRQNLEEMSTIQENYERKQQEMEVLNHSIDLVLLIAEYSTKGEILSVNENYSIASGYTNFELIGKTLDIELEQNNTHFFDEIWNKVQKGNLFTNELRKIKKDGSVYYTFSNFVPILDDFGQVLRIKYVGQDITFNKDLRKSVTKMENKILQLQNELKYSNEKSETLHKMLDKKEQEFKKKIEKLTQENELKTEAQLKITEQERELYKTQYNESVQKNLQLQKSASEKENQLIAELKVFKDEIVKNRLQNQSNS